MMMRKSKGRQRIEIAKMANKSHLSVTFSRRRSGLFKKVSELSTLCGAEVAAIFFSPGKNVFSFGHPSVESVIERFISRNPPQQHSGTTEAMDADRNLNMQLTELMSELEAETKRREGLRMKMRETSQGQNWWEDPLDGSESLLKMIKENAANQVEIITMHNSNAPQFYLQGSKNAGQIQLLPHVHSHLNSNQRQFFEGCSSSSGGIVQFPFEHQINNPTSDADMIHNSYIPQISIGGPSNARGLSLSSHHHAHPNMISMIGGFNQLQFSQGSSSGSGRMDQFPFKQPMNNHTYDEEIQNSYLPYISVGGSSNVRGFCAPLHGHANSNMNMIGSSHQTQFFEASSGGIVQFPSGQPMNNPTFDPNRPELRHGYL